MRPKALLSVVAVLALGSGGLAAQELPAKHYTTQNEVNPLPLSPVTSVYQDRLGFLWIANYGLGLVRYDGQAMELYEEGGGGVGAAQAMFRMHEDGAGRLWGMSSSGGAVVSERPLSAYTDTARVQFVDSLGGTPLYREVVSLPLNALEADTRGWMWLGVVEGVVRYRFEGTGPIAADTIRSYTTRDGADAPLGSIGAILARRDGSVWVSTSGALLASEGGGLDLRAVATPPCNVSRALHEDAAGTLWGACGNGRLWRLDEASSEAVEVGPLLQGEATALLEIEPGTFWVGGLGFGIWEIDTAAPEEAVQYTRENGLLDANVWDLATDREGALWVSQNTGLSKLRAGQAAFRAYTAQSHTGERPVLPGEALAIASGVPLRTASGDALSLLAVGTAEGLSLIREDGSSEHLTAADGLGSNIVLDVCTDAGGGLWATTRAGAVRVVLSGAGRAPPGGGARQSASVFGTPATLVRYDLAHVNSCGALALPDAPDSVCFASGNVSGLTCQVGDRWFGFGEAAGNEATSLWSSALDAAGHLWVGTRGAGLLRSTAPVSAAALDRLATEAGRVGAVDVRTVVEPVFEPVLDASGEHVAGEHVRSLLRIGETMWMAGDASVFVLDTARRRVVARLDEEELDGGIITLAHSPEDGVVWAGGRGGLVAIDAESYRVARQVRQHDGLLDDVSASQNAVGVGPGGVVYQATSTGVSVYRPGLDAANATPPLLAFRRARYTEDGSGDNELDVAYAALSFGDEKQVRYRTRLVGYDEMWSAPTAETSTRYTNLSAFAVPREYTFEVVAANEDGVWAETPIAYTVRVSPPWWLRWWALLGYGAVLVGGVFAVDRVQRRRLLTRERAEAELRENALRAEAAEARAQYLQAENERTAQELAQAQLIEQAYDELRQAKDRLVQQEKMASLGALTAGIAHEIKNPLNFVTNFAGLSRELADDLADETDPDEREALLTDLKENAAKIEAHGRRADAIVRQMMAHARSGSGRRRAVALDALAREYAGLASDAHRVRRPDHEVALDVDVSDVGEVEIVPDEIGRVVVALVDNALDAAAERAGREPDVVPTVTVSTGRSGGHVEIRVADNGVGMDAETAAKVFEPFFTTKPTGQGTGLGLSLAHDVVVQGHGGRLSVESAEGAGSTFVVALPVEDRPAPPPVSGGAGSHPEPATAG